MSEDLKEAADDLKEIALDIASGDNPLEAVKEAIDENKDGKISLAELKANKWTIIISLGALVVGYLLGDADRLVNFVQDYWGSIIATVVAYAGGWSSKVALDGVSAAKVQTEDSNLDIDPAPL